MNPRLFALTFTAEAQADADGVHQFKLPFGFTIVHVSACVEAYASSGSTFNLDIQDDGTDVITAVTANTAATPGVWESTHVGGTNAPVTVAADSVVDIDINLDTGTADYTIVILALANEV
jgi:hypothetical protein